MHEWTDVETTVVGKVAFISRALAVVWVLLLVLNTLREESKGCWTLWNLAWQSVEREQSSTVSTLLATTLMACLLRSLPKKIKGSFGTIYIPWQHHRLLSNKVSQDLCHPPEHPHQYLVLRCSVFLLFSPVWHRKARWILSYFEFLRSLSTSKSSKDHIKKENHPGLYWSISCTEHFPDVRRESSRNINIVWYGSIHWYCSVYTWITFSVSNLVYVP